MSKTKMSKIDGSRSRGRARGNPFMSCALWEPVGAETEAPALEVVEGAIPKMLHGCYLRIGPNPQFPKDLDQQKYHFFGGDGMVHCVELNGGTASYRNLSLIHI